MGNTKLKTDDLMTTNIISLPTSASKGLGAIVEEFIENYFIAHEGLIPASGLYDLVLQEVEKPLLRATLKSVKGNQKRAAEVLGINRNTLRKKLQQFQILPESH